MSAKGASQSWRLKAKLMGNMFGVLQTLETEVARVNSSFAQVAQKLKELQHERGKEVDGLQDELLSAQHSIEQQRVQLQDAEAKMHSGLLDQENRGLSIDGVRSKLAETCASSPLCQELLSFVSAQVCVLRKRWQAHSCAL